MITHHSLPFRPDIQGLRAIAIVLVVLAHAEISVFSGGFVGVDVFFVLSGYLITGLLVREYANTGNLQFTQFIVRRLKRLLPSLIVMLILVMLIAPVLITAYEFTEQTASAAYASTWTSNLYFAFSALDYFSELQTRDLFLHTWSLGVEEQFYVVWPALLFLILELAGLRILRGNRHTNLLLALGILFVGSLGLSLYWTSIHPLWSFYLMPSRIWQFALGAGVFVWSDSLSQSNKSDSSPGLSSVWGNRIGISGLFLIIGSAVFMHPNMTYPGYWALLPSIGAALIIAAGSQKGIQGISRVFSHPTLVWIGDRSYSWYLWHWPVLILGFAWGKQYHFVEAMSLIALSLMLATLSYRWVELPFWKGRLSYISPARSILLSILVMVVVAVGVPKSLSFIHLEYEAKDPRITNEARMDVPVIYSLGCDNWYLNAEVRPCIAGAPEASKTVVLFADSIGAQWFSLLPGIYKAPEWRMVVLTKSACPIVDEDFFYARIGRVFKVCSQWRNAVLKYLSSLKPSVIIIGSDTTYGFSREQWTNGTARILARLTTVSDQVLVIPGTPELSFDGPSCLEKNATGSRRSIEPSCRKKLSNNSHVFKVAQYLETTIKRFPKAALLNLTDLACPEGVCSARTPEGIVVFRDQKHLTDTFVRAQIPGVLKKLKMLGLDSNTASNNKTR